MNRNAQLIRVLKILYHLLTSTGGVTIHELSRKFAVHIKTIRRDLVAIGASDFKLKSIIAQNKKKYVIKQKITEI